MSNLELSAYSNSFFNFQKTDTHPFGNNFCNRWRRYCRLGRFDIPLSSMTRSISSVSTLKTQWLTRVRENQRKTVLVKIVYWRYLALISSMFKILRIQSWEVADRRNPRDLVKSGKLGSIKRHQSNPKALPQPCKYVVGMRGSRELFTRNYGAVELSTSKFCWWNSFWKCSSFQPLRPRPHSLGHCPTQRIQRKWISDHCWCLTFWPLHQAMDFPTSSGSWLLETEKNYIVRG